MWPESRQPRGGATFIAKISCKPSDTMNKRSGCSLAARPRGPVYYGMVAGRPCVARPAGPNSAPGGWRRTYRSPTGSGPEGSSPNEPGRVFVQPPTSPLPDRMTDTNALDSSASGARPRRASAAASRSDPLSRAGAQIPADQLRRSDRAGRDGENAHQRLFRQPHPSGLHPHRRARGRQDDDGAHSGARVQLFGPRQDRPPERRHAGTRRALPGDHRTRATSTSSKWTPPRIPASRTCARSSRTCAICRSRRAPRSTSSTKCTCSPRRRSTRC